MGIGGAADSLLNIPAEDGLEEFWNVEYQQHLVRKALEIMQAGFEPRTWQACWEHTVNDKTAAAVGQELSMSEGAVYVAKSRVLRRLRQELAGLLE